MIEIAKAPIDADLLGFSRWLSSQGVPHRVVEEQSEQVLLMPESEVNEKVRQALVAYLDDTDIRAAIDEQSYERVAPTRHIMTEYPRAKPLQAPIVFVLMLTSIVVAWLTNFGQGGALLRALLIVNPLALEVNLNTLDGRIDGLWMMLGTGEYWRLITPDILHFSLLHICFNLVMLWVLGGQAEMKQGTLSFMLLVVVVSVCSNVAQFLDSGYFFGGLSGVVYGLFGYCWVWKRFVVGVYMPDALFRFSLIWLMVGYTPLTEWLGLGRMANSAHLYGLLSGLIWAWIVFSISSKAKKSPAETES